MKETLLKKSMNPTHSIVEEIRIPIELLKEKADRMNLQNVLSNYLAREYGFINPVFIYSSTDDLGKVDVDIWSEEESHPNYCWEMKYDDGDSEVRILVYKFNEDAFWIGEEKECL